MNFNVSTHAIYTINPVNVTYNEEVDPFFVSRHITLEFYSQHTANLQIVETRKDKNNNSISVVCFKDNAYISDKTSLLFAQILSTTQITIQPAVNNMLEYIFFKDIIVASRFVKSLENYFPGYTARFLDTVQHEIKDTVYQELMGDFVSEEFRSKTLEQTIKNVFDQYPNVDPDTKREVYRDVRKELTRIKSRLDANIKTAKKSTDEAIHAYILRAMVSSQQR